MFGTIIVFAIVLMILAASVKVLKEYERGVIFTLGRYWKTSGPGLIIIIPLIQQLERVDLRIITMDIPPQHVISKDNISVNVNAVLYFKVMEPDRAIIQVEDVFKATSELAQTTLRSVLGQHDLDEMLSEREKLNENIQKVVDTQTDIWGIKVSNVEIKHIDLDDSMIRVIAKQAEAERSRRAKVIHAEGELQASMKLKEAAEILSREPQALQLRYLQTLTNISEEKNSTIVFPLPLDLITPLKQIMDKMAGNSDEEK